MKIPHDLKTINDLQVGDHACLIYDDEFARYSSLKSFLRKGFERGAKVFYLADSNFQSIERLLTQFRYEALDMEYYLKHSQLIILDVDDSYVKEGVFDSNRMIAMLEKETDNALAEGYSALYITGEMSWVTRSLPGSEFLGEYEAKVNKCLQGSNCLAICQYDKRCIDPSIIIEILIAHPFVIIGNEVYENEYYVPPEDFIAISPQAAILNTFLKKLAKRKGDGRVSDFSKILEEMMTTMEEVVILGEKIADTYQISQNIFKMDRLKLISFFKVLQSHEGIDLRQIFNDEIRSKLIKIFSLVK